MSYPVGIQTFRAQLEGCLLNADAAFCLSEMSIQREVSCFSGVAHLGEFQDQETKRFPRDNLI